MTAYDNCRPLTSQKLTESFVAIDVTTKLDHGQHVGAIELSSFEYKIRFGKLQVRNNMKVPTVCESDVPGYLVVGKPGTRKQYETWLPDHIFEGLYKKVSLQYVAYYPCR